MGCGYCGDSISVDHYRSKCDIRVCTSYRLPENHNCASVFTHDSDNPGFESDSHSTLGQTSESTDRRTGDSDDSMTLNGHDDGLGIRDAASFLWNKFTPSSYYLVILVLLFTISATALVQSVTWTW